MENVRSLWSLRKAACKIPRYSSLFIFKRDVFTVELASTLPVRKWTIRLCLYEGIAVKGAPYIVWQIIKISVEPSWIEVSDAEAQKRPKRTTEPYEGGSIYEKTGYDLIFKGSGAVQGEDRVGNLQEKNICLLSDRVRKWYGLKESIFMGRQRLFPLIEFQVLVGNAACINAQTKREETYRAK